MRTKKSSRDLQLYPLEKVRFILKDACALDVAYAFDDLVFAEHGLIIIQFGDKAGQQLNCWFNIEMIETEEIRLFDSLAKTASLNDTKLTYKGRFNMKQSDKSEKIDIEFVDSFHMKIQ